MCVHASCTSDLLGVATVLAAATNDAWLALDDDTVFWSEPTSGDIRAVAKTGGPVTTVATGEAAPKQLATDGLDVFWSAYLGGAIKKVSTAGGAPTVVAAANQARFVTVDATYVYWISDVDNVLQRAQKSGGAAEWVADLPGLPGQVTGLASDAEDVFFSQAAGNTGCHLHRVHKATGAVTAIGLGYGISGAVALSATSVFGTCNAGVPGDNRIGAVPKTGGAVTWLPLQANLAEQGQLATDDCHLFASLFGQMPNTVEVLLAVPDHQPLEVLGPPLRSMVVDGAYVYGIGNGTAQLLRVAK
ncbi:MAG: hypothetical protein HY908_28255 [Myxococcales bacterium]|nr:hypothetical protein [Myxococcales bacterium]